MKKFHFKNFMLVKSVFLMAIVSCATFDRNSLRQSRTFSYCKSEGAKYCCTVYSMQLLRNYNYLKVLGSHEEEHRFLYSDSSCIYITNDSKSGSPLNYINAKTFGAEIYSKKLLQDTLIIEGRQSDGRLWKESKLGDITVGYVNVSKVNAPLYNDALNSIRIKKSSCK